ncbi:MAG: hypothetical protein ACLSA6_16055 [Holdemania massiliensis]
MVGGCNAIGIFFAGLLFGLLKVAQPLMRSMVRGHRDDYFFHDHHAGSNAERHYLHYEPIAEKEGKR